jgi:hypothetical protein
MLVLMSLTVLVMVLLYIIASVAGWIHGRSYKE